MPQALPAIAAAWAAVSTAAVAVGTALTFGSGIMAGLTAWSQVAMIGALGMALTMKPPGLGSNGQQVNIQMAGPNAALPLIFGRTGTQGIITYRGTYGQDSADIHNRILTVEHVLSLGPVAEVQSFSVMGRGLAFSGNPKTGLATVTAVSGVDMRKSKLFRESGLKVAHKVGAHNDTSTLNSITGDTVPGITSADTMQGLARTILRCKLDEKRLNFPDGYPDDPISVVKGVLCYDPRLDDTQTGIGGSGDHRVDNPSTHEWSENPYIVGLNFALGWWTPTGTKLFGIGAELDMIDVAGFAAAANVADANHWTVGGQVTSDDGDWAIITNIFAAGGGIPIDRAGKLSCFVRAPKVSTFTLEESDVLGTRKVTTSTPMAARANRIVPSCRQENQKWEMIAGEAVTDATWVAQDNGIVRTEEIAFPLVSDFAQAHQLAAYYAVDSREFLEFEVNAKPRALAVDVGDCIEVNLPEFEEGQTWIVMGRKWDPASKTVALTLKAETFAKHAFCLGQSQVAPEPPTLTTFDPSNPQGPDAADWEVSANSITQVISGSSATIVPAIVIAGEVRDPNVATIIVETREPITEEDVFPDGTDGLDEEDIQIAMDDFGWTQVAEAGRTASEITVAPLRPVTTFDVSIRYQLLTGAQTERLILAPVTTAMDQAGAVRPGGVEWDPTSPTSPIANVPNALVTDANGMLNANTVAHSGVSIASILDGFDADFTGINADVAQVESDLANAILESNSVLIGALEGAQDLIDEATAFRDQAQANAASAFTQAGYASANATLTTTRAGYALSNATAAQTSATNALNNAVASAASAGYATSNATSAQTSAGYAGANATISQTQAGYAGANASLAATNASLSAAYSGYALANATATNTSRGHAVTNATLSQTQAGYATSNAATAQTQSGLAATYAGYAGSNATAAQTSAGVASTQSGYATTNAATAFTQAGLSATYAGQAQSNATIAQTQSGYATSNAATASTQSGLSATFAGQAQSNATLANTARIQTQANATISATQAGYASANATSAQISSALSATHAGYAGANATAAQSSAGVASTQAGYATSNASLAQTNATLSATFSGYASSNASLANAARVATQANAAISQTQAGYATANAATASTQSGLATTYAGQALSNAALSATQLGYATANASLAQSNAALAATYSGQAGANAASAAAQATIATSQAGYATSNAALAATNATLSATRAGYALTNATVAQTQAGYATANAALASASATLSATYRDAAIIASRNFGFEHGLTGWSTSGATVTAAASLDGRPNVVTLASGTTANIFGTIKIPFDPARKYRIRGRYHTGAGTGSSQIYIGFRSYDAAGASLTHAPGSYGYVAALGVMQAAGAGWVEYVSGVIVPQASGIYGYPPGTAFIAPISLMNYNSSAIPVALDEITIEDVTESERAASNATIASTQAGYATANAAVATTQAGLSTTFAGYAATNATAASTSAGYSAANASISSTQAGYATSNASLAQSNATLSATFAGYANANAAAALTRAGYSAANATISTTQAGFATSNAALAASNATLSATFAGYANSNAGTAATQAGYSAANATISQTQSGYATSNASIASSNATLSATRAGYAATNATAAQTQAGYSAANATISSIQAGYAAANATFASTNATLSATRAGYALTNATVAQTQAGYATANAALAQTSATLAASVGMRSLNKNAGFDSYPSTPGLPTDWLDAHSIGSANFVRSFDETGGYAVTVSSPGIDGGLSQVLAVDTASPSSYFVLEAEFSMTGTLAGSGAVATWWDNAVTTFGGAALLSFAADPDSSGTINGAGVAGRRYSFSKLFQTGASNATRFIIYGHNQSSGNFGASTTHKAFKWFKFLVRPATAQEVASGVALPAATANVTTLQTAVAGLSASNAIASWSVTAAASGGLPTRIALSSSTYGSNIALMASEIYFGANTVFDDVTDTMRTTVGSSIRVIAFGAAFGTDGTLTEWEGPAATAFASMSRANAYFYRANAAPYVGGASISPTFKVSQSAMVRVGTRVGAGSATTATVTLTPTGHTGTVTYTWTNVFGDSTVSATASTSATTAFSATVAVAQIKQAQFAWTATDSGTGITLTGYCSGTIIETT